MSIAYDIYVSLVLNESNINTEANPEFQPSLNKVLFYDAIVGFYPKSPPSFVLSPLAETASLRLQCAPSISAP